MSIVNELRNLTKAVGGEGGGGESGLKIVKLTVDWTGLASIAVPVLQVFDGKTYVESGIGDPGDNSTQTYDVVVAGDGTSVGIINPTVQPPVTVTIKKVSGDVDIDNFGNATITGDCHITFEQNRS